MPCRLCLKSNSNPVQNILNSQLKCSELSLIDALYWIFGVEVDVNDPYSKFICARCENVIRYVGSYRTLYRRNQLLLEAKPDYKYEDKDSMDQVTDEREQLKSAISKELSYTSTRNMRKLKFIQYYYHIPTTAIRELIMGTNVQADDLEQCETAKITENNDGSLFQVNGEVAVHVCKYCSQTFMKKSQLDIHYDTKHKATQSDNVSEKIKSRKIKRRKKLARKTIRHKPNVFAAPIIERHPMLNKLLDEASSDKHKKKFLFDSKNFPNLNFMKRLDMCNKKYSALAKDDKNKKKQSRTESNEATVSTCMGSESKSEAGDLEDSDVYIEDDDEDIEFLEMEKSYEEGMETVILTEDCVSKDRQNSLTNINHQYKWLNLKDFCISVKKCAVPTSYQINELIDLNTNPVEKEQNKLNDVKNWKDHISQKLQQLSQIKGIKSAVEKTDCKYVDACERSETPINFETGDLVGIEDVDMEISDDDETDLQIVEECLEERISPVGMSDINCLQGTESVVPVSDYCLSGGEKSKAHSIKDKHKCLNLKDLYVSVEKCAVPEEFRQISSATQQERKMKNDKAARKEQSTASVNHDHIDEVKQMRNWKDHISEKLLRLREIMKVKSVKQKENAEPLTDGENNLNTGNGRTDETMENKSPTIIIDDDSEDVDIEIIDNFPFSGDKQSSGNTDINAVVKRNLKKPTCDLKITEQGSVSQNNILSNVDKIQEVQTWRKDLSTTLLRVREIKALLDKEKSTHDQSNSEVIGANKDEQCCTDRKSSRKGQMDKICIKCKMEREKSSSNSSQTRRIRCRIKTNAEVNRGENKRKRKSSDRGTIKHLKNLYPNIRPFEINIPKIDPLLRNMQCNIVTEVSNQNMQCDIVTEVSNQNEYLEKPPKLELEDSLVIRFPRKKPRIVSGPDSMPQLKKEFDMKSNQGQDVAEGPPVLEPQIKRTDSLRKTITEENIIKAVSSVGKASNKKKTKKRKNSTVNIKQQNVRKTATAQYIANKGKGSNLHPIKKRKSTRINANWQNVPDTTRTKNVIEETKYVDHVEPLIDSVNLIKIIDNGESSQSESKLKVLEKLETVSQIESNLSMPKISNKSKCKKEKINKSGILHHYDTDRQQLMEKNGASGQINSSREIKFDLNQTDEDNRWSKNKNLPINIDISHQPGQSEHHKMETVMKSIKVTDCCKNNYIKDALELNLLEKEDVEIVSQVTDVRNTHRFIENQDRAITPVDVSDISISLSNRKIYVGETNESNSVVKEKNILVIACQSDESEPKNCEQKGAKATTTNDDCLKNENIKCSSEVKIVGKKKEPTSLKDFGITNTNVKETSVLKLQEISDCDNLLETKDTGNKQRIADIQESQDGVSKASTCFNASVQLSLVVHAGETGEENSMIIEKDALVITCLSDESVLQKKEGKEVKTVSTNNENIDSKEATGIPEVKLTEQKYGETLSRSNDIVYAKKITKIPEKQEDISEAIGQIGLSKRKSLVITCQFDESDLPKTEERELKQGDHVEDRDIKTTSEEMVVENRKHETFSEKPDTKRITEIQERSEDMSEIIRQVDQPNTISKTKSHTDGTYYEDNINTKGANNLSTPCQCDEGELEEYEEKTTIIDNCLKNQDIKSTLEMNLVGKRKEAVFEDKRIKIADVKQTPELNLHEKSDHTNLLEIRHTRNKQSIADIQERQDDVLEASIYVNASNQSSFSDTEIHTGETNEDHKTIGQDTFVITCHSDKSALQKMKRKEVKTITTNSENLNNKKAKAIPEVKLIEQECSETLSESNNIINAKQITEIKERQDDVSETIGQVGMSKRKYHRDEVDNPIKETDTIVITCQSEEINLLKTEEKQLKLQPDLENRDIKTGSEVNIVENRDHGTFLENKDTRGLMGIREIQERWEDMPEIIGQQSNTVSKTKYRTDRTDENNSNIKGANTLSTICQCDDRELEKYEEKTTTVIDNCLKNQDIKSTLEIKQVGKREQAVFEDKCIKIVDVKQTSELKVHEKSDHTNLLETKQTRNIQKIVDIQEEQDDVSEASTSFKASDQSLSDKEIHTGETDEDHRMIIEKNTFVITYHSDKSVLQKKKVKEVKTITTNSEILNSKEAISEVKLIEQEYSETLLESNNIVNDKQITEIKGMQNDVSESISQVGMFKRKYTEEDDNTIKETDTLVITCQSDLLKTEEKELKLQRDLENRDIKTGSEVKIMENRDHGTFLENKNTRASMRIRGIQERWEDMPEIIGQQFNTVSKTKSCTDRTNEDNSNIKGTDTLSTTYQSDERKLQSTEENETTMNNCFKDKDIKTTKCRLVKKRYHERQENMSETTGQVSQSQALSKRKYRISETDVDNNTVKGTDALVITCQSEETEYQETAVSDVIDDTTTTVVNLMENRCHETFLGNNCTRNANRKIAEMQKDISKAATEVHVADQLNLLSNKFNFVGTREDNILKGNDILVNSCQSNKIEFQKNEETDIETTTVNDNCLQSKDIEAIVEENLMANADKTFTKGSSAINADKCTERQQNIMIGNISNDKVLQHLEEYCGNEREIIRLSANGHSEDMQTISKRNKYLTLKNLYISLKRCQVPAELYKNDEYMDMDAEIVKKRKFQALEVDKDDNIVIKKNNMLEMTCQSDQTHIKKAEEKAIKTTGISDDHFNGENIKATSDVKLIKKKHYGTFSGTNDTTSVAKIVQIPNTREDIGVENSEECYEELKTITVSKDCQSVDKPATLERISNMIDLKHFHILIPRCPLPKGSYQFSGYTDPDAKPITNKNQTDDRDEEASSVTEKRCTSVVSQSDQTEHHNIDENQIKTIPINGNIKYIHEVNLMEKRKCKTFFKNNDTRISEMQDNQEVMDVENSEEYHEKIKSITLTEDCCLWDKKDAQKKIKDQYKWLKLKDFYITLQKCEIPATFNQNNEWQGLDAEQERKRRKLETHDTNKEETVTVTSCLKYKDTNAVPEEKLGEEKYHEVLIENKRQNSNTANIIERQEDVNIENCENDAAFQTWEEYYDEDELKTVKLSKDFDLDAATQDSINNKYKWLNLKNSCVYLQKCAVPAKFYQNNGETDLTDNTEIDESTSNTEKNCMSDILPNYLHQDSVESSCVSENVHTHTDKASGCTAHDLQNIIKSRWSNITKGASYITSEMSTPNSSVDLHSFAHSIVKKTSETKCALDSTLSLSAENVPSVSDST